MILGGGRMPKDFVAQSQLVRMCLADFNQQLKKASVRSRCPRVICAAAVALLIVATSLQQTYDTLITSFIALNSADPEFMLRIERKPRALPLAGFNKP